MFRVFRVGSRYLKGGDSGIGIRGFFYLDSMDGSFVFFWIG